MLKQGKTTPREKGCATEGCLPERVTWQLEIQTREEAMQPTAQQAPSNPSALPCAEPVLN